MGQPLKIEDAEKTFFITIRTMSSRLWFLHNKKLEQAILAYLARYLEMYSVIAYGFILMGNHYHLIARFPKKNKRDFCKAFNSMIAKLTEQYVSGFDGKLWARRFSDSILPNSEDIEHYFFYMALNPVSSGVTRNIRKYSQYNSFFDAATRTKREFEVFEKSAFNEAIRRGKKVDRQDFTKRYTLQFEKLPGYESLAVGEYRNMLLKKLEQKSHLLVREKLQLGHGFADEAKDLVRVGARPRKTKTGSRDSFRPVILCLCSETKKLFLDWYFTIKAKFKEASNKYRAGDLMVEFPIGTYKPLLSAVGTS